MNLSDPNLIKGIDVSHYQGVVDWNKVKASGIQFGICKATDGPNRVDPTFSKNWPAIKGAGLVRGAYHFGHAGFDANQQAEFFSQTVGQTGAGDLKLALDMEVNDNHSAADVGNWVKTFVARLTALRGGPPMIYTGAYFWNTFVKVNSLGATSPLWIARYPNNIAAANGPGNLPAGWNNYNIWQFGTTEVNGVGGAVDTNIFNGTADDFKTFANIS